MKLDPLVFLPLFASLCDNDFDVAAQIEIQILIRGHYRDQGCPPIDEEEFRRTINSRLSKSDAERVLRSLPRILSCMQTAASIGKNWVEREARG